MNQATGAILCFSYILGLLLTVIPWGSYGLLGLGFVAFLTLPLIQQKITRKSRKKLKGKGKQTSPPPASFFLPRWVWFVAGIIGFLASLYLQARTPTPAPNDISQLLTADSNSLEQVVTVRGIVASVPRLTRSGRVQFWLEANQVSEVTGLESVAQVNRQVVGKVYTTVPLLQTTGVLAGDTITITGNLYKPLPPANPGAFDFRAYLAREGAFAGLAGQQIDWPEAEEMAGKNSQPRLNWQTVRKRIVQSQINWLGVPEGPLVSAITLGKQAVDLPYDIRDTFVLAGLAHAIAASGTQVSLILGLILAFTKRFSPRIQFSAGVISLILLLGLTGLEPSICRAAFMGLITLIAIVLDREIKPLGALLLAATLLLLVNPLWIQDLGFQLSFLATLGLVVTVPPLMKRLDWLPPTLATTIAVPLAASVWTQPRLIAVFSCLVPYSILTNILTAILITIISIGGLLSAMVALVWSEAGSAIAWFLYYPTRGLIEVAQFFAQLPGNVVNVGRISTVQEIALYSLMVGVWIWGILREKRNKAMLDEMDRRKRKRLFPLVPLSTLIAVTLIAIPAWNFQASTFQVTVLSEAKAPILVIQDRGNVTLVNSGDEETVRFTVLPFLAQQGINQINWAIAANSYFNFSQGWLNLLEKLPIQTFYENRPPQPTDQNKNQGLLTAIKSRQGVYQPLELNQTLNLGSVEMQLVDAQAPALQLQIGGRRWLMLGDIPPEAQKRLVDSQILSESSILWWTGENLIAELLQVVRPSVAIASAENLDPDTAKQLRQLKTQLFWTGRDGALVWTEAGGFRTTLEPDESEVSLL